MPKSVNIRGMNSDDAYKALKAAGYAGLPDKSPTSAYGMVGKAIKEGAVVQVQSKAGPRRSGSSGSKPW